MRNCTDLKPENRKAVGMWWEQPVSRYKWSAVGVLLGFHHFGYFNKHRINVIAMSNLHSFPMILLSPSPLFCTINSSHSTQSRPVITEAPAISQFLVQIRFVATELIRHSVALCMFCWAGLRAQVR